MEMPPRDQGPALKCVKYEDRAMTEYTQGETYLWPQNDPPCDPTCSACRRLIRPGDKFMWHRRRGQHEACAITDAIVCTCLVQNGYAHNLYVWPRQEPPRLCLTCKQAIHPDQIFFPLPPPADDFTRKDDEHYERLLARTAHRSADDVVRKYVVAVAQRSSCVRGDSAPTQRMVPLCTG